MKRKTKEVSSSARPKPKQTEEPKAAIAVEFCSTTAYNDIVLQLTAEQHADLLLVSTADSHGDRPAEWALKVILRHLADRKYRI